MGLTLIKSQSASNVAQIDFIHGTSDVIFDTTYSHYAITYMNINPVTDGEEFMIQATTDGTNFNLTMTTSYFQIYNAESGSSGSGTNAGRDLDQDTTYAILASNVGNGGDENAGGIIHIFRPADTTYAKHFLADTSSMQSSDYCIRELVQGYWNTTSAIDGIRFSMSSGNMDGEIKMYGIS